LDQICAADIPEESARNDIRLARYGSGGHRLESIRFRPNLKSKLRRRRTTLACSNEVDCRTAAVSWKGSALPVRITSTASRAS